MGKSSKYLYYITHIDNVKSILDLGILSHEIIERDKINFTPIYDTQIVSNRRDIKTPDNRSLWEFANLYFQPRNPMLYRVLCEKSIDDIVILAVQKDILNRSDIFISNGNAAHSLSNILHADNGIKIIPQIMEDIKKEWWKEEDGSKRKIMAECLVPNKILSIKIDSIYVANHSVAEKVKNIIKHCNLDVIPEPYMFFENPRKIDLTQYLSVVEGDVFFSRMQTLTISVNTVGIMGKGLASRAKYQFPDIYVLYQDLCRKRVIKIGRPYLYKPEYSLDSLLADEPLNLSNANLVTWFLLFPTKRHWKEQSDIKGIEEGLQWLKDNYKREGITSLAIPALGCGLGRLNWKDVGPLICRYLSTFDIKIMLYLPAEKKIEERFLTKEFLLGES